MKFLIKKTVLLVSLFFVMACSPESPKQVPKSTQTGETVSQKPADLVSFNPKVDILFVIDNSGSMSSTQSNLSQNATIFSNAITANSILDYHIAVTSTDMDNCGRVRGGGACGELYGYPKFIDKNTPSGSAALAKNILIGVDGSSSEFMFTPVMEALTTQLSNPSNRDFYRPDAYLAVIFITDADDQSSYSASEFLKFLVAKKGDANKVLGYGVIRTLADARTCYASETIEGKLESFLASVVNADKKKNNIFSLCSTDYGIKLAQFAKDIVKRSSGEIRLQRIPDTKTIKVTYGTQVIPNSAVNGWVYENSTNSILLSPNIKFIDQGPGISLSIDFETIKNP